MLNYFYNVLPREIQDYIWELIHQSRVKDMHDNLENWAWTALRNSADNAEQLEIEEANRMDPAYSNQLYYWHPQNNIIAHRLHDIRRIKELNGSNTVDSKWYLSGFNYTGSHYNHYQVCFGGHLLRTHSRRYIESMHCIRDGRAITDSMITDSYWYPNITPYIKNTEVFHRWTYTIDPQVQTRSCVYIIRAYRLKCDREVSKHMFKKEIKDNLKQIGLNLKGISKMNKTKLIDYYYTESKTRKIGEIIND
jgi:hypothetical protein